ncbi:HPr kinase/phosphorylase [Stagnihabitans tardus]|uniref:Serine kinase n=1 Tax=Stagnihabitans tardus TaxID=2699202 RepID=A0AAE4Y9C0_9RHOB|nr:HPr kinase/phosphatase C-terminal domain-containing protein [Stagnihabitans tardus]NBZ87221.1 serine kinase [Stagnihabitans tardus]
MPETLHASCVALADRGLLILGRSGAGKSALALNLMALGCDLVADDRTEVTARDGALFARAPDPLKGLVEARGIGLLRAPHREEAQVTLVIDLDQPEPDRLPPLRHITVLGIPLPLVFRPSHDHLNAAILCYLKGSRFA